MILTPEQATKDFESLEIYLRAWHNNKDSENLAHRHYAKRDYLMGQQLLERMIDELEDDSKIQLTIGRTALDGKFFTRSAYDMLNVYNELLEPGSEIDLLRVTKITSLIECPPLLEYYFGDVVLLSASSIGQTLCEGGRLSVASLYSC